MVSVTGVTIIRQTVKAVAGPSRNICVNAAGGTKGLNGTLPRRVTSKPLKARKYAHFDSPLTDEQLVSFSITPQQTSSHSFFPLLGYQKSTRKIDFSVFPPLVKHKDREIRYASHTDSAIYSKYAQVLSSAYETLLSKLSLGTAVLAYRGGIGYNVPFAKSLIDEIKLRGNCRVICLDISGFFDNIPHDLIKNNVCRILNEKRLPTDWFKILNRVTKFEYVLREDLEKKLGKVKGHRICEIDTFRRVVRPMIRRNSNTYGIPQGTPLSGLLANISMIDFDIGMIGKLAAIGGSYRRYSDDIAIVLPAIEYESDVVTFCENLLSQYGLSLSAKKTCRTTFTTIKAEQTYSDDVFQYLGFTYDGSKILIRPESVKNFYARMKGNIDRYIKSAFKKGIPGPDLRKRVLIGRFTHWGDSRNFVQYAYRASLEMQAPEIRRQLRNHVAIFDRQWNKMTNKYGI